MDFVTSQNLCDFAKFCSHDFPVFYFFKFFLNRLIVDTYLYVNLLLNVKLCKNPSSVAQIVSEIWLFVYRELIPNECCENPKMTVFVTFGNSSRS